MLVIAAGWLLSRTTRPVVLAAGSQATVIGPEPLSLGLKPDARGIVSIVIKDARGLYGVEFHLAFDPDIVEVVDADASRPGIQIQSGGWLTDAFVAVNQADNTIGRIDYAVTLLNPAPPANGSGRIGLITFKAKTEGISPLKIEKASLVTRDAQEISTGQQEGVLGVSLSGQAPELDPAATSTDGSASDLASWLEDNRGGIIATGLGIFVILGAFGVLAGIRWMRRRRTDQT